MHHFLYTFFIALTNNVDNVGVRIAYSIRGIKIGTLINGWISVITFVISTFAAFSGTMISGVLSKQLSSVIAMLLLTAIGLWMILEPYVRRKKNGSEESDREDKKNVYHVILKPEDADMDNSKHIDFKEATLLGIAMSINNVGGGLSAGMIGLSAFWVGFLSAVLSFIALWAGNYIAEFFTRWNITHKAAVVAGILLIAIGIEQIM
ncbi:MAG TPA: sporulation membrane protein YtaF [Nitrospiraceae bacterium]|jgi:putative sporulation protein YtaF|nr:sporulation membrane protein YtaF [Nitrospiraceae bacterium]